jgi:hypothetical protein
MANPTLFIGVVSHSRSSFTVNQGEKGLAAKLAEQLNEFNTSAVYSVNILNDFESAGVPATSSVFRAGIADEVRLEREWNKFLGVRFGLRAWIGHMARWLRVQSFLLRKPDTKEIKRLINIELSHTKLMKEGLDSGAEWVLILEDDAATAELEDLAQGLMGIFSHDSHISFVNLSRSFELTDLGIDHLLHSDSDKKWAGTATRQMLFADRPATNTVCAILYHRNFLESLINEFELIPSEPVVPIDWRLNQALMNLWNKDLIGSGDCWFVEPAPIDQLSMRST